MNGLVLERKGDFEIQSELKIPVVIKSIKTRVKEVITDPHDPTKKLIKTRAYKSSEEKLLSVADFKKELGL